MTNPRPGKKPLYFGDPNATMTMCVKKLRRHLPMDITYLPIVTKSEPAEVPGKVDVKDASASAERSRLTVLISCKHCKQNPLIDEPVEPANQWV